MTILDDPFTLAEPVDAAPGDATGDLTCESCGNSFFHTGRGRKPKRCPDCRTKRSDSSPRTPRGTKLKEPLENLYGTIGFMLMPFDPVCAEAVMTSASACAASLDALAKQNPAVRRFLEGLTTTSVWGAVVAAHAPLIMTIASHHVPAVREMMNGETEGS